MADVTRRAALIGTGAAAALAAVARAQTPGLDPRPGVQLWAVNAELDRDFAGTLRALYAIGYRRVEAAGWHGRDPRAFAAGVREAGLTLDSAHISIPDLMRDLDGRIGEVRDAGCRWIVSSSPDPGKPLDPNLGWIDAMMKAMDAEAWRRNFDDIARIGERASAAGLAYAHHNHPMEFTPVGGFIPAEEILRRTDPAQVHLELDVGWCVAGGADPVDVMTRHPGRIALLHLKDLKTRPRPGGPADWTTVPLGRGVIDWRPVLATAARTGVRGWYVEQEPPFIPPALQSLTISLDYLRGIGAATR